MRNIVLILMVAALSGGCGVELLTTTAITSDLQAQQMDAMKGQIEHAAGQTGKVNLQRAVDLYYAEKGKFPQTLAEVAPAYIASVPVQTNGAAYGYAPSTGRVSETDGNTPAVNTAAGPTGEDMQHLRAMGAAIQQYARSTKRYPASLQALVPQYIPEVPTTSSGRAFTYNPQLGLVNHPDAPAPPAGRPRGGQAQEQWDPSRGFGNARSQHQLETMDNLGL